MEKRLGKWGIGNTPACAGKTEYHPLCQTGNGEHPRVRGEDLVGLHSIRLSGGTPPRARGRLWADWVYILTIGNTPACAGKTQGFLIRSMCHGEHPRVRGEDVDWISTDECDVGTPPRARGRLAEWFHGPGSEGNTPACAGKTPGGLCDFS